MPAQKTYRLKGIVHLLICEFNQGCSIGFLKAQITAPGDEIEAAVAELLREGAILKAGKGYYKKRV